MKKTQALIASAAIALLFQGTAYANFDSFNRVAQASPDSCDTALQSARDSLAEGREVTIETRVIDLTRSYSDYPPGRPIGYLFVMEGSATSSILNSSQLLTLISESIISNCQSVSAVEFAPNSSSYFRNFGLLQETVREFRCQDFDREQLRFGRRPSLVWGEQVCL